METLEMESRIVKLENQVKELKKRVDDEEIAKPYTMEYLIVNDIMLKALQKIAKVTLTPPITDAEVEMYTIAWTCLREIEESKPDCAPCDAHVDEQDERWQRKYEIAMKHLDVATEALREIARDEKVAGNNLENSPATQALQRLQGVLIPDSW